MTGEWFPINGA